MFNQENFAQNLSAIRQQSPLVHCITNDVVINFTANILLAIGASPAMVISSKETADFTAISSALSINVGTITERQHKAMIAAVKVAQIKNIPWVLDPVAYGVLQFRTEVCRELLEYRPTVIRGNASEIMSMAGLATSSKGTDSTVSSEFALESAQSLAQKHNTIVAVTGKIDYITDGSSCYSLSNGNPMLTQVTGTGCALSSMLAAYCAICKNPIEASLTAIAHLTIASEIAATESKGVGSFAVSLLDNLSNLHQSNYYERLKWAKI